MLLEFNLYQTMALVALVFYLGKFLRTHITFLDKYCIPPSVAGGFVFSFFILILQQTNTVNFQLDMSLQDLFMKTFFTSIGFMASFKTLKAGGLKVFTFLGLATLLLIFQNTIGVLLASAFGLSPLLGLSTGSISMSGGHGTSGSFGPILVSMGVEGATTVALASATFGLVLSNLIGGLVGHQLILRHKILHIVPSGGKKHSSLESDTSTYLSVHKITSATCLLFLAMGIGSYVSTMLEALSLTFPTYMGGMLVAAVIRNLYDFYYRAIEVKEIQAIGSLSLSFFLTMSLMTLKLRVLFELALPLIVMLLAQVVIVALFTYFITFRVMGKNYDGVVFASALCGFGMGTMSNAMANMDELTCRYGFASKPYFVVPLVGCLFIDFVNSSIITLFINFLR